MRPLLTAHQVAQLLALPGPRSFSARRRRLEAEGFPPPVPGLGLRWDPVAIDAWRQRVAGMAPIGADQVAGAEAELIARARAVAMQA